MVVWLNLWKVPSRHGLIMPPKKNEEKFTEMLDEALQPIKEAMENLITKEMMTKLISGIEDKLVKKMIEQGREIDKLKLSNRLVSYDVIKNNVMQIRSYRSKRLDDGIVYYFANFYGIQIRGF